MREHFNGEQSCEEQREEEKLAALLEEQMRKEAEQIEKELEDNPEIAALSPDDSAKEKLYERIEEYERQQAVRRLSPEDQEALRLGRQLQKEKAAQEEATAGVKAGRGKKRFLKRLAGVAAVFVIVAAVGITGVGGPDRVMEVLQQVVGSREMTQVESDDKDTLSSGESEEEKAYQEIKDKLGIDPVRIITQSSSMRYEDMEVDEYLKVANLFYECNNQIISYIINCSQRDGTWGFDIEDTLINEYTYTLDETEVIVEEYRVEGTDEKKYSARFDYKDIHYQLTGNMTKEEMEEILDNLHFL
nr:DUF4367 domain-containing protein [uncultured Lachnoclostridium sp.]